MLCTVVVVFCMHDVMHECALLFTSERNDLAGVAAQVVFLERCRSESLRCLICMVAELGVESRSH